MSSVRIIREMQYGDLSRVSRRTIAEVTLGLTSEAIHGPDIGFTAIDNVALAPYSPSAGTVSLTRGTWLAPMLQRAGSMPVQGNHASIQAYGFGLSANGTPIYAQLTGSITVRAAIDGW